MKNMLENFLNHVVGFRSRKKFKMIIAGLYYLTVILGCISGDWITGIFLLFLPWMVVSVIDGIRSRSLKKVIPALVLFFIYGFAVPSETPNVNTTVNEALSDEVEIQKIEEIIIDSEDIFFDKLNQEIKINYTFIPDEADGSSVVLISDNPDIARFDGNVLISVTEGETDIYAMCTETNVESKSTKVIVDVKEEVNLESSAEKQTENNTENLIEDAKATEATKNNVAEENKVENITAPSESAAENSNNTEKQSETETGNNNITDAASKAENVAEPSNMPVSEPAPIIANTPEVESSNTAPVAPSANSRTVYIGQTGTKYHSYGCRTLKGGGSAISLDEALAQGRAACKVCGG